MSSLIAHAGPHPETFVTGLVVGVAIGVAVFAAKYVFKR